MADRLSSNGDDRNNSIADALIELLFWRRGKTSYQSGLNAVSANNSIVMGSKSTKLDAIIEVNMN